MLIKPNHKYLQYSGRIDHKDPCAPVFLYAASMVTVRFRGSGISAVLYGENLYWDSYMGVLTDGAQSRIRIETVNVKEQKAADPSAAKKTYVLAEGLEDAEHTVVLFKRQDSSNRVTFLGFELSPGCELLEPPPRPARRMEVYGDSVSAGEISEAVEYTGKADPEHNGEYSNVYYSYAWMTARRLGAELHDIAQGGIALLDGTGYFGVPGLVGMESVWDKLQYNAYYAQVSAWDFSRYTPHVVIAAIGQNDNYPEDYMKEDFHGEKAGIWMEHYQNWIGQIRRKYPRALIVLATTILNHDKHWDDAIEEVCRRMRDERIVHFLYQKNGCGTPGHIRIGEAEEMAEELAAFIEKFGEEIWQS